MSALHLPQAAHVIRPDNCAACKFAQPVGEEIECRARSPQTHLFLATNKGEQGFALHTVWPRPHPTEWCGEFRPKVSI